MNEIKDKTLKTLVINLSNIRKQKAAIEAQEKELKQQVSELMASLNITSGKFNVRELEVVVTKKQISYPRFSQSILKEKYPTLYEECKAPYTEERITIK